VFATARSDQRVALSVGNVHGVTKPFSISSILTCSSCTALCAA
jgi:hypothetical protein